MRQDMVAHMEELRVCRATDIRLRTLKRRVTLLVSVLSTRPPPTPRVVDLYSLDSIRTLLDKPLDGGDDTVTVEEFSAALAEMGHGDCTLPRTRSSSTIGSSLQLERSPSWSSKRVELRPCHNPLPLSGQ
jgi:hypothetical protein